MIQHNAIELTRLRPTQMTVGMRQVKHKRAQLQALSRRPGELVQFILEHSMRVVLGPKNKAYLIDHHHLALALIREKFESAPMQVEDDLSTLTPKQFWKTMQELGFVHPIGVDGKVHPIAQIPKCVEDLENDPYRSLAGFVLEAGGYKKVGTPYAEFVWADFYRALIKPKLLKQHFKKALKQALALAKSKEASNLPGYTGKLA